MVDKVLYISSARDDAEAHRILRNADLRSPVRLCLADIGVFTKNLPFLMNAMRPMHMAKPLPGVHYEKPKLIRDYMICGIVSFLQLIMLIVTIPLFLVLPGLLFLAYCALSLIILWGLCRITWGDIIVSSRVKLDDQNFSAERWFFINGIATSHSMLQTSCDMLSATFKRPITGIYNKSFGMIGDLVECLIQRSFDYQTEDVRIAYEALKTQLEDSENVDKVMVIAHSQGGILISLVLDRLYTTMPSHVFRKLEIYTFGSAAAHFHNPMITLPSEQPPIRPLSKARTVVAAGDRYLTNGHTLEDEITDPPSPPPASPVSDPPSSSRYIPVIEHYCNALDIVPRWGVLFHVHRNTPTTYSGKIFVHEKQTGHLFDQHYLETMFPVRQLAEIRADDDDSPSSAKQFLNHVVKEEGQQHIMKASTFVGNMETAIRGSESDDSTHNSRRHSKALRVKDLSKLWRYLDGGDGIA